MSTSSRSTVKRCASSLARSSTSPTSRSSRSASAATTSSDSARAFGSSASPSRSASTWPRIAVSGVRSSCETDIRKFRSCSSASREPRRPSRGTAPARWLISSAARHVRDGDVVLPAGDPVGGRREREHGPRDPAGEVPREQRRRRRAPTPSATKSELDEREPAVRSSVFGFATTARRRSSPRRLELERLRRRRGKSCARRGGVKSNVITFSASDQPPVHRRLGQLPEAGVLAGEDRHADVEEPRAGRPLELGGGEVGGRAAPRRSSGSPPAGRAASARAPRAAAPTSDCDRMCSWNSCTAIAVETIPASATPAQEERRQAEAQGP